MATIDFDPTDVVPLSVQRALDLERYERERREADMAYTKEQAKMLFDESGTGKIATLTDGTAPQWGPGYGGRYQSTADDWARMTLDEQSTAMEKAMSEYNGLVKTYRPFATKINTPSYDKRTNYHLAGLVRCGVDIVKIDNLDDSVDAQYLYPRYGDSGELVGGAFFIRNA